MSMTSTAVRPTARGALGVAVFDLERALLAEPVRAVAWGASAIAAYAQRPQRLSLAATRVRAARALQTQGLDEVRGELARATLVRGAREAVSLLQRAGVVCALASLGWDFGLETVAERLNIQHCLGSSWEPRGGVVHVWQEDEDEYPRRLAAQLGVPAARSALLCARVSPLRFAHELLQRWG